MPPFMKRSFHEILGGSDGQASEEETELDEDELAGDPTSLQLDIVKRRRVCRNRGDTGGSGTSVDSGDQGSSERPESAHCLAPNNIPVFDGHHSLVARDPDTIQRHLSHVDAPGPDAPLSTYQGWQPDVEIISEGHLLRSIDVPTDGDYVFLDLEHFTVYRPNAHGSGQVAGLGSSRHSLEICTLDKLNGYRLGVELLVFDGTVVHNGQKRYLQGVPFRILSIDGYGDTDLSTMTSNIFLQSKQAEGSDVWYRLGKPSQEYRRFYAPFIWLAQFVRLFVSYVLATPTVAIHHFRENFYKWIRSTIEPAHLRDWQLQAKMTDFRTTVAANIGFLYSECYGLNDWRLMSHPVWREVDPHAPSKVIAEHQECMRKTVVTPFVYECFKTMYFGKNLQSMAPTDKRLLDIVQKRKANLGLTPSFKITQDRRALDSTAHLSNDLHDSVQKGDVVCLPADNSGKWSKSVAKTWYAYVQGVHHISEDCKLDLLWLYEPSDTTIGKATYPFPKELFLSDNCACGMDAFDSSQILAKVHVDWQPHDPTACAGLFVRQKFRTIHEDDSYDFVSMKDSDFTCTCSHAWTAFEECANQYLAGDTILYMPNDTSLLEPAKVDDFDRQKKRIIIQPFSRTRRLDPRAPANELTLGGKKLDIAPSAVIRVCHVRFFPSRDALPSPYDRNGSGDYWYCLESDASIEQLKAFPPLRNPMDILQPHQKEPMTGLGIFCGGGNLDRGLEEGGAVKFKHAVDWATNALHSYRANVDDPADVNFFLGSVNDYLAGVLTRQECSWAASIGAIDLISAGSPCPGFSQLQINKLSDTSLRNASMVASVVAFVDMYSPRYLVLENVINLTRGMGANKDENVFSAIIAALLGLGYQVQQFLMDAWTYGSCQSRSRVFIIASAPGIEPLPPPPHTHSQPPGKQIISLGQSSNGLSFGLRQDFHTPFPTNLPKTCLADLPDITDAQVGLCIRAPDHRTPSHESSGSRSIFAAIPTLPRGMGYVQAYKTGLMHGRNRERYQRLNAVRQHANSRYYTRVHPEVLFPTVTTVLRLGCAHSGRGLHWDQHRSCTVMELRRVQGFLDHEVIVGTPGQQVKIIGNSVDRHVAFALGQSLRESWLKSPVEEHGSGIATAVVYGAVKAVQTAAETFPELHVTVLPASAGDKRSGNGRLVGAGTNLDPIVIEDVHSEEGDGEAEELSATSDRPNSPAIIVPHLNHISVPPNPLKRSRTTSVVRSETDMSENITVANGWDLIGQASTPSIDERASEGSEVAESALTTPDALSDDRAHYRVGSASMRVKGL